MDVQELQDLRDRFKRECMSRLGLVDERLRPVIIDIDLRADDLFVEFRSASSPVPHELRERLRVRVDRLYELTHGLDATWRPYCRTVYAYAQYVLLYRLNGGPALMAMRQLFERELASVQGMPSISS